MESKKWPKGVKENMREGEMQVRVGLFASALFVALVTASASAFGAAAPAVGDAEWNKTLAAAKKEGKIVIIGPSGSDVRDAYTVGFQKKYPEIEVDFSGMRGAEVAPKLLAELNAKHYLTDIAVAGTTTALASLVPANAVVPLQPYLVGPEAKDVSKWRDRKHHFSDSTEKYNLYFGARVQVAFVYNTELNPPATMKSKIKTWQDLLNPEWKGKIAILDPRQAGAGLDLSTYWYTNEKQGLGKEFIRKLFTTQEIFVSREEQQILDFVARGRHAIAIGPSGTLTFQLISRGLPLALFGSGALPGEGFVTASNGTITVVRNAPHQNAIKVYIDYLLSQEGQINWSKASGLASLRTDVPKDHIPEVLVPDEGVKYQETHLEKYVMMRKEIVDFLNTVMRR
jgi:iron(III) transport system substrate-binding protein